MHVLLVNDDGVHSPGLHALYRALIKHGHNVSVVAPEKQNSGAGHSLTVFEPLISREVNLDGCSAFAVSGTPADCVKLALGGLLPEKPDLVMSGINLGPNVGPDLNYSGTVGAAAEGAHEGLPSMAISHLSQIWPADLDSVADHAVGLASRINWRNLQKGRVININYPDCPIAAAKMEAVCPQSPASWENIYERREDPRGRPYWWLKGVLKRKPDSAHCDLEMLLDGHITITPLKFEYTDMQGMDILKNMLKDN